MNPQARRRRLSASLAGLALAGPAPASAAQSARAETPTKTPFAGLSFALIGDLPYGDLEALRVPALLADLAEHAAFAIHVGDIKFGRESCSDALLESRLAALARSRVPLVYVPGDNEWLDCWRESAGAHDPLERLQWLRARVFDARTPVLSMGQAPFSVQAHAARALFERSLEQQSRVDGGLPENLRWIAGDTLFITLNLPGSKNGIDSPLEADERHQRDAANRRWMQAAAARAARERLGSLAIAIHANPNLERGLPEYGSDDRRFRDDGNDGYAAFRADLGWLHRHFEGELLLMHGDTHYARVNRIRPRLTRVECFGFPFGTSWLRIEPRPGAEPPFSVSFRRA